jgi:hypothetical protein
MPDHAEHPDADEEASEHTPNGVLTLNPQRQPQGSVIQPFVTFRWRNKRPDECGRGREQGSRTMVVNPAERDELRHRLGQSRWRRSRHSRRAEVGHQDAGGIHETVQLRADARHRSAHDGLIGCGEKHAEPHSW